MQNSQHMPVASDICPSDAEPVLGELVSSALDGDSNVDLVTPQSVDLLLELEVTREAKRCWKRRGIAAFLGLGLLLVVSLVQFAGTFVTCSMLNQTQVEAKRTREMLQEAQAKEEELNEALAAAHNAEIDVRRWMLQKDELVCHRLLQLDELGPTREQRLLRQKEKEQQALQTQLKDLEKEHRALNLELDRVRNLVSDVRQDLEESHHEYKEILEQSENRYQHPPSCTFGSRKSVR
jgi:septal ring factor EnvC (AmiA/AmiB activator)